MREGRKKVKGLGNRLDRVREKVKASEVRLREREKRVGRRLKMLWISCGVWMGILVVLAMMRQWRSGVVDVKVMHSQNKTLDDLVVGKVWGYRIERARNHGREDWRPEKSIVTSKQARTTAPSKSGVGTEATLRLFDEL